MKAESVADLVHPQVAFDLYAHAPGDAAAVAVSVHSYIGREQDRLAVAAAAEGMASVGVEQGVRVQRLDAIGARGESERPPMVESDSGHPARGRVRRRPLAGVGHVRPCWCRCDERDEDRNDEDACPHTATVGGQDRGRQTDLPVRGGR